MENKAIGLDKAVKLSIIAGALIVAFSIAYYLVIFLPQKDKLRMEQQRQDKIAEEQIAKEQREGENKKELQDKVTKCAEDAKRFHQDYIGSIRGYYFEPQYHYNELLNKCLYSGGYRESQNMSDNSYWERIVKDVYTNETLLSAYKFWNIEQINEFWEKHKELMSD